MENNTKSKQDCGCEGDCCQPKSKPKWIKYLSFLILLAAISIVVIKVVQDKKHPTTQCAPSASGKSCCGDSSKTANCDTTNRKSCCTKSGK